MGIRTFLAIDLSASLRSAVAQHAQRVGYALADLSPAVSWVPPDNLHVTVKFFGETPDNLIAGIRRAVERAVSTCPPFAIELKGVGAFPDPRAPRVLWTGIGGDLDALTALAERVVVATVPLGFPQEDKPFHPHLTVARVTRAHREVGRTLGASGVFADSVVCGRLSVERVALFKSERRAGGSVYTALWDVSLAA